MLVLVCVLGALVVTLPVSAGSIGYRMVTKISLPGKGGHGDWVTYDPGTNSVYVALHGSGVAVIGAATNKVVTDVDPIKGPNGIAYDSEYVYAAAGDTNELVTISKKDWKIASRVKTKGTSPDGVWFDSTHGTVLVASDDKNWIEVYSAGATPKLLRTIALQPANPKAGPDVGVLVTSKGILYMPDDALVEEVNLETNKVGRAVDTHVKLAKTGGTKGMIYDPKTNHLWVGTTAKEVLVLDASTLATVATVPARSGIDEVAFDPGLRLVYTFEGSAKGFEVYSADEMKRVAYVNTGSGNTHTGDVDPKTHRVYAYEGDANVVGVYAPVGAAK